jgi:8-oxo-dGTP pyrophosphatase MutT (NUDIX family)
VAERDPRTEATLTLVDAHTPLGDEELGHKREIIRFLESAERPFDRETRDHLTAGGIVVSDHRVLLVHHRRLGMWVQPGGHIDSGDSGAPEAALREVAEETGLRATLDRLVDVDVHMVDCGGRILRHLDLRFLMHSDATDAVPNAEVNAARWVAVGDLDELGADPGVRRAVTKAIGTAS